ncbi:MAG: ArnT family glycosyltransferase [Candidatus Binataceae bacterium]
MPPNPQIVREAAARDEAASVQERTGFLTGKISAPRIAIPLIIALGLLLFIVNLGGYPFYTKGEPREAVTVLDIVNGGGIVLPMRAGVEIPSKPPLMHWFAALASVAAGVVNEWTVRLPSAIFAIGGMLLCYFYIGALFDDRSGLLAALILGTTIQYLQAGSGARVDMTLTFFMEAAFFEFIMFAEGVSRRWILLYFAVALAVLAKGPVGLALPAIAGAVWLVFERRWRLVAELKLYWGALIVLVIDGGWYLAASLICGPAFVHKQVLAENLFRFFGNASFHEGHVHPFYYLEGALILGFIPWTFIAPAVALQFVRGRRASSPRLRYLAVWCLVVLIFYSFARSKRGVYLLSLYPALAALFGIMMADAASNPQKIRRWIAVLSRVAGVFFATAGAAVIAGVAILQLHPALIASGIATLGWDRALLPQLQAAVLQYRNISVAIALAAIGISVMLIARASAYRLVIGAAAGVTCLALIANLMIVPALARTVSLKGFTASAMRIVDDHSVAYVGGLNYDIAFYSGRVIPIAARGTQSRPDFLLCWRRVYDTMPPRTRGDLTIALASHPARLDGKGVMLLLRRGDAPASANPNRPPPH